MSNCSRKSYGQSNHRSRGGYNLKKSNGKRNYTIGRNQKKSNKRTESLKEIRKE